MGRSIEGRVAKLEATTKSGGMRILVVGQLHGESDEDLDRVIQKLKSELPSRPDQIIVLRYCGTTPDGKRFMKLHGYPNNLRIPGFNTSEPHDGAQSEATCPDNDAPPVVADTVGSDAPRDNDKSSLQRWRSPPP